MVGILDLEKAFRDNPIGQERLAVYFKYLKDLTIGQFEKSVKRIIMSDNFFPSIARIRDAAGANISSPPKSLSIDDINNLHTKTP